MAGGPQAGAGQGHRGHAVFLDRDGVLNRAVLRGGRPYPPCDVAAVEIPAGTALQLGRLKAAGFELVVVTNQPDVVRGTQTRERVEAINAHLAASLPVDEVVVCYADGDHPDRKPNPGMLLDAARRRGLDLARSWMVGDRHSDILAGARAGCRTILLGSGYGEAATAAPTLQLADLGEAVRHILSHHAIDQPHPLGHPMSDLVINPTQLKVQIWADGADKAGILELDKNPVIKGFTTNPSLMAKVGIKDYPAFAKDLLTSITVKPVSFEVFSDDLVDMERQARLITTWGKNVYTKIPITNTKGESCIPLIRKLAKEGVKLNVTALLTLKQVVETADAVRGGAPSVVSVFAGRIADTGRDPVPYMHACAAILEDVPSAMLLWASTRELLNIYQAEETRCGVITVPHDVLKKLSGVGRGLGEMSLDTVKGFLKDSTGAGFKL